jgi:oxaloacetate decarboxylase (Na+ extruding) subunit gamma
MSGALGLSGDVLIEQGVDLMLYGMGTVFVFLTLLVIITVLMSAVVQRWLPDDEMDVSSSKAESNVDARIVAIIEAALAKHRCRRK